MDLCNQSCLTAHLSCRVETSMLDITHKLFNFWGGWGAASAMLTDTIDLAFHTPCSGLDLGWGHKVGAKQKPASFSRMIFS